MTTILDVHLCAHNQRLENKVVLITGERDAPQCTLPHRFLTPLIDMQGAPPASGEKPLCSMPGQSVSLHSSPSPF